jgi:hypothetical protein
VREYANGMRLDCPPFALHGAPGIMRRYANAGCFT